MSQVADQACLSLGRLPLQCPRESRTELWSLFICPLQAQAHTTYPGGGEGVARSKAELFPSVVLAKSQTQANCLEIASVWGLGGRGCPGQRSPNSRNVGATFPMLALLTKHLSIDLHHHLIFHYFKLSFWRKTLYCLHKWK